MCAALCGERVIFSYVFIPCPVSLFPHSASFVLSPSSYSSFQQLLRLPFQISDFCLERHFPTDPSQSAEGLRIRGAGCSARAAVRKTLWARISSSFQRIFLSPCQQAAGAGQAIGFCRNPETCWLNWFDIDRFWRQGAGYF